MGWGQIVEAAGGIIGGVVGGIGSGFGIDQSVNQRNWDYQMNIQKQLNEQAAELNYGYGEKAADNAQQRGWETYEKYQSPKSMVKQYEEAGLNPALMYGQGGASGGGQVQTGAQGGGSGNQQAGRISEMIMAQQQIKAQNIQGVLAITQAMKNMAEAGLSKTEMNRMMVKLGIERETAGYEKGIREMEYWVSQNEAFRGEAEAVIARIEKEVKQWETGDIAEAGKNAVNQLSHERGQQIGQSFYGLKTSITNAIMSNTKESGDIDVKVAKESASELAKLLIDLRSNQVSNEEFTWKMKKWLFDNKNLFKGMEVGLGVLKSILGK